MNAFFRKVLKILLLWIKWVLIQYLVLLVLDLLGFASFALQALFKSISFREAYLTSTYHYLCTGSYSPILAIELMVPINAFFFSIWKVLSKGKKWSLIIPWLFTAISIYFYIAWNLDWNFKIITFDSFMAVGVFSPLFGAAIQGVKCIISNRKLLKELRGHFSAQ